VPKPLAVRFVNAWPSHLRDIGTVTTNVDVARVDGALALLPLGDSPRVAVWPVRADASAPTAVVLDVALGDEDNNVEVDMDSHEQTAVLDEHSGIAPAGCCALGGVFGGVLVAAGGFVSMWPDALRAPASVLRVPLPHGAGRATVAVALNEHCCVVGTDRGRLLLVDTSDEFGTPMLNIRRAVSATAATSAAVNGGGGLLSSLGSLFSWGRASRSEESRQAIAADVHVDDAVIGLLRLDDDCVAVWTEDSVHLWHPGRLVGSTARLIASSETASEAEQLIGATPDTRVRLLDAAVIEDDRLVVIGVVEPRDSSARPADERRVCRLALIDVSVGDSQSALSVDATVVLPPSARGDTTENARLLVAGDGCAYVVNAGSVLCVDVDLALVAEHDAVQRYCIQLPPLTLVAAGVQPGERGPTLFVTRAHGAFACARSAGAAPRDVQRAPRAHAAAAVGAVGVPPASLSLAEAIRVTFDGARSLPPAAAAERVRALLQRAGSDGELADACVAASAALLNAQPASHPHWAELGGSDRLSALLSNQLEQKQELHDALIQFFAARHGAVSIRDAFDAAADAALARHSQAIRAARALRQLQNDTALPALADAIRATVGAWNAAEADSDAWRAFGVHDHFYHSVLRVPEVLRQLARSTAAQRDPNDGSGGAQLRECNAPFVVVCRVLSPDAVRAAHVSDAVRAQTELTAAFVERQQHQRGLESQQPELALALAEQLAVLVGATLGAADQRTLLPNGGEEAGADGALDAVSFAALRGRLLPLLASDCAEQHRALAERFRDFEALAELCERSADGDALLLRYMDMYRGDGFHAVVYRRCAQLGGTHRAQLLQQAEAQSGEIGAFLSAWPQLQWPESLRYRRYGEAADALLAATADSTVERERTRVLCSLARVAALAGNDAENESRAAASLRLLRLGDVLLGKEAPDDVSAAATDFDDNASDLAADERADDRDSDDVLADDAAILEGDAQLLTARATFVAALRCAATRRVRVTRAATALQCWRAGALASEQAPFARADVDVARRRLWRAALGGAARWRRVATAWSNGQLSDAAVEAQIRSSAAVQVARTALCPTPLPTRDEALQLALGGGNGSFDDEIAPVATRLFDAVWALVVAAAQTR
jgi:hypothetical protein